MGCYPNKVRPVNPFGTVPTGDFQFLNGFVLMLSMPDAPFEVSPWFTTTADSFDIITPHSQPAIPIDTWVLWR
jgi:hypothetical protein